MTARAAPVVGALALMACAAILGILAVRSRSLEFFLLALTQAIAATLTLRGSAAGRDIGLVTTPATALFALLQVASAVYLSSPYVLRIVVDSALLAASVVAFVALAFTVARSAHRPPIASLALAGVGMVVLAFGVLLDPGERQFPSQLGGPPEFFGIQLGGLEWPIIFAGAVMLLIAAALGWLGNSERPRDRFRLT